ncbi:MAG TPA: flagellar biosynthesis protein FliQ [Chloroflexota bacterium]|nr:flagellar biosynthesis protein FliQ [Chloroflexota bacterium]
MTEMGALELGRDALMMTLLLSAPVLLAALVVGLVVSIVQALTQINESTLSFVPKILAVFGALAITGGWLMSTMLGYTVGLFNSLPQMVR